MALGINSINSVHVQARNNTFQCSQIQGALNHHRSRLMGGIYDHIHVFSRGVKINEELTDKLRPSLDSYDMNPGHECTNVATFPENAAPIHIYNQHVMHSSLGLLVTYYISPTIFNSRPQLRAIQTSLKAPVIVFTNDPSQWRCQLQRLSLTHLGAPSPAFPYSPTYPPDLA